MSAITTVTLTDATPVTPVDRSFVPLQIVGDKAMLTNRSSVSALGDQKLHITVKHPKGNELYGKVTIQLVVPTLEVSAGSTSTGLQAAPTKAYDNYFTVESRFHRRSTEQERKDLRVMMIDGLATALITDAVDKLLNVY